MIDENLFFRNATLKISSSLDPDEALKNLLEYLVNFMPIKGMDIGFTEIKKGIMHFIAWATTEDSIRPSSKIQVPEREKKIISKDWSMDSGKINIYNDIESLPKREMQLFRTIWECKSLMTLKCEIEGRLIGGMSLWMDEKNGFTEERVKLIELLHDPVALALTNMMRFHNVNSQKDLLTESNLLLHKELIEISGNKVIGANSGLKSVMQMVRQVAPLDSPVLLLGETGVGKEVIANAIHASSNRKDKPFIKVNCGAIPETLIDSELFGHEKGSFTGAHAKKRGKFELADTGTIFLDEIGELSLSAQVKLLRVLQEKEIERVGGTTPISIDTRIICATHRNILNLIGKGRFREDLWFRLNVFPINIPPLRQRMEDIPALVNYFVKKKTAEMKLRKQPIVSLGALEQLNEYNWPGNVRELNNLVERSIILNNSTKHSEFFIFEDLTNMVADKNSPNPRPVESTGQEVIPLNQVIENHIRLALKKADGRVTGKNGAAQMLKLNPNTLWSKMRKYGISRE